MFLYLIHIQKNYEKRDHTVICRPLAMVGVEIVGEGKVALFFPQLYNILVGSPKAIIQNNFIIRIALHVLKVSISCT